MIGAANHKITEPRCRIVAPGAQQGNPEPGKRPVVRTPMAGSTLHHLLRSAISGLEGDLDQIRNAVTDREETHRKVRLLAYAGYRNERLARIKGRIVRYAKPLDAHEGFWIRLKAMLDIYHSHELPDVEV